MWFLAAITSRFSCKGVLIHQLKIGQCIAVTCAAADPSFTLCLILLLDGRQDSLSTGKDHEIVFEAFNVSEDTCKPISLDEAHHKELAISSSPLSCSSRLLSPVTKTTKFRVQWMVKTAPIAGLGAGSIGRNEVSCKPVLTNKNSVLTPSQNGCFFFYRNYPLAAPKVFFETQNEMKCDCTCVF